MEENNNNEVEQLDTPVMEAPVDNPVETAPDPVVAEVETKAEDVPAETVTPMPEAATAQPETGATEEPKKKSNLLLILLILVLLVGGGVAGFIYMNNNSKDTNTDNKETTEKPTQTEPILTNITYEEVKEIYAKYHTDGGTDYINTYGRLEPQYIYGQDKFDVKDLKELTSTYAEKIYEIVKEDISDKVQTEGDRKYYKPEDIEETLKNALTDFFGGKVKFSRELFAGIHVLRYQSETNTYEEEAGGGGLNTTAFKFEMTNYKLSEDGKTLTIEEKATIRTPEDDGLKEDVKNYIWTYELYNKTFVLSTVELVK